MLHKFATQSWTNSAMKPSKNDKKRDLCLAYLYYAYNSQSSLKMSKILRKCRKAIKHPIIIAKLFCTLPFFPGSTLRNFVSLIILSFDWLFRLKLYPKNLEINQWRESSFPPYFTKLVSFCRYWIQSNSVQLLNSHFSHENPRFHFTFFQVQVFSLGKSTSKTVQFTVSKTI